VLGAHIARNVTAVGARLRSSDAKRRLARLDFFSRDCAAADDHIIICAESEEGNLDVAKAPTEAHVVVEFLLVAVLVGKHLEVDALLEGKRTVATREGFIVECKVVLAHILAHLGELVLARHSHEVHDNEVLGPAAVPVIVLRLAFVVVPHRTIQGSAVQILSSFQIVIYQIENEHCGAHTACVSIVTAALLTSFRVEAVIFTDIFDAFSHVLPGAWAT